VGRDTVHPWTPHELAGRGDVVRRLADRGWRRLWWAALGMWLAMPAAAGPLTGPVLDAGRAVVVEDIVQLPFSSGSPPHARLNVLREAPDGSGRLFVNDLRGPLHVIDGVAVHTYMDFSVLFSELKTSPGLASGFVSFAFHPDFANNGLFYTVHSEFVGEVDPNLLPTLETEVIQHSILTEWQATDPALNAFSGSSRELIRIGSHHNHHNMGEISFDPAASPGHAGYGLLYIAAGDFGSVQSGQPAHLQRLDTPYGAILRIDPLGGSFMRGGTTYDYGIPGDNPFANDGDPDTLDEIYAYGFRNAHRIVWDTAFSGESFATDIGEENIEEIDVLTTGANYGWPEREGNRAIDVDVSLSNVFPLPPNDATFGYTYPAAQYDHDDVSGSWSAIAGGVVYRKSIATALHGELIFGDIVDGSLFHVAVDDLLVADDGDPATTASIYELEVIRDGATSSLLEVVRDELVLPSLLRTDLRIGHDLAGEIYITTKRDAFVRKLTPIEVAYPNGWQLEGTAVGGNTISFTVSGVALQITTTAGQTAAEVAEAMVDEIQQNATLQGLEIYGFSTDEHVLTNGTPDAFTSGDPGIVEAPPPAQEVPLTSIFGTGALLIALLGVGARAAQRPPRSFERQ
jgi:hypothetical protein